VAYELDGRISIPVHSMIFISYFPEFERRKYSYHITLLSVPLRWNSEVTTQYTHCLDKQLKLYNGKNCWALISVHSVSYYVLHIVTYWEVLLLRNVQTVRGETPSCQIRRWAVCKGENLAKCGTDHSSIWFRGQKEMSCASTTSICLHVLVFN
jgi:hypothetical protein